MNNEQSSKRSEPCAEEAADLMNEAGSIGDEQCPAYVDKTDKHEWNGASTRAKTDHILPKKIREFLNGL